MYTRYTTKNNSSSSSLDDEDVQDELYDLCDEDNGKFADGAIWNDDDYESDELGKANSEDESFAYALSDEIFDDREAEDLWDVKDLLPGDLIYDERDHHKYGIVVRISGDECIYASVDSDNEIRWDYKCDLNDIDEDFMYTRY